MSTTRNIMWGALGVIVVIFLGFVAMNQMRIGPYSANADAGTVCDSSQFDCEAADAPANDQPKADAPKAAPKSTSNKDPQKGSLKGVALDDEEEEDCRFNIAEGAVSYVSEDCIISGDVLIAETEAEVRECARIGKENQWRTRCAYHDNNQLSGHTVLMLDDGYAYAAWGASVHSPGADPEKTILAMKENMGLTGCGNKTVMPDGSHLKGCAWKVYAIGYPDRKDVK